MVDIRLQSKQKPKKDCGVRLRGFRGADRVEFVIPPPPSQRDVNYFLQELDLVRPGKLLEN